MPPGIRQNTDTHSQFLVSFLSTSQKNIMRSRPASRQRRGGHAATVVRASTAGGGGVAATILLTTTTTLLLFSSSLLLPGVDAFVVRPSSGPSSGSSCSTTSIRPSSFFSGRSRTAQWSTSNKPTSGQEERDWKQALLEDDDLDIDAIIAANKEVRKAGKAGREGWREGERGREGGRGEGKETISLR